MSWKGIIREFQEFLPKVRKDAIVTIPEGNTPLIETKRLRDVIDKRIRLFLKYEGLNPTGSFKDRGMTLAVSKAVEAGAKAIICASTGNTSASAGAYAARAGIKAVVLIPEGKIAQGKLSQAIIHGAEVIQITGNFDDALNVVKEIADKYPVTMVNSLNPFRIEGQKTASFEVCNQLGGVPDYHFMPVGNAGNITAYWKGYKEFFEKGRIPSLPKMMGFQAEGAAPIVRGHIIKAPETIATAIRIGNPANWENAVKARDESKGAIEMVSDEEIINAYHLLAEMEGVFAEPASAASIAGLIKLSKRKGVFKDDDIIVCTLTGHGLKDPGTAIESSEEPVTMPPDIDRVVEFLGFCEKLY
ncbi:MAG: threonine synthase [Thermodesulfobacteriota bacterium]